MIRKIASSLFLIGFTLSGCMQTTAVKSQKDVQPVQQTVGTISSQILVPTERIETPEIILAPVDDPLSTLKGKMVKDEQGMLLLLLGFVNTPNAAINFQFPESYQFPHEHVKDDFRILDSNGVVLEFEEVDPGDLNLYIENPLGEGILDPRVFRIIQKEVQGPLTLEMVNLIQVVNLTEQSGLSFSVIFSDDFPLGQNLWNVDQTIDLIPDHLFMMKYFDATVFNDENKGQYSGPQGTFLFGTYYLEAAGFEGITFNQIVPADRKGELPMGWGGSIDACTEMFTNCIRSDAGLLKTEDNLYELQITAYRLIVQGPWQAQFDMPK
jgi:hypothetical protein